MPTCPSASTSPRSLYERGRGDHDADARTWARAAVASGADVLLRFAPEMNGDLHASSNGDRPREYRRAWRHLHALFAAEGATMCGAGLQPEHVIRGIDAIAAYWPGLDVDGSASVSTLAWCPARPDVREREDGVRGCTVWRSSGARPARDDRRVRRGPDSRGKHSACELDCHGTHARIQVVVWFEHVKETDKAHGNDGRRASRTARAPAGQRLAGGVAEACQPAAGQLPRSSR